MMTQNHKSKNVQCFFGNPICMIIRLVPRCTTDYKKLSHIQYYYYYYYFFLCKKKIGGGGPLLLNKES